MSEMEEKLNTVLSNPQMMQQIMSMAQSLGQSSSAQKETVTGEVQPPIDLALVQKLSGLAGQSAIDSDQRALLQALHPYLSHNRVIKLEKAMRAAKMAKIATSALGGRGMNPFQGR